MADEAPRGRTRITSRAVRRVVSAVTAEALDVSASDVSVELADDHGELAVQASSPIHVDPLGAGIRSQTLLDRLGRAQTTVRDRTSHLTGSTVGRVDLRITGVDLNERRRVS